MPAVWGLARSAAAGAGAPRAVGGIHGRMLSHTLYALAVLVPWKARVQVRVRQTAAAAFPWTWAAPLPGGEAWQLMG